MDSTNRSIGTEASYAVAPILSIFANLANGKDPYGWDVFFINIETLIRNIKDNKNKERTNDIVSAVINDMHILHNYIINFISRTRSKHNTAEPIIVFYTSKYENIPSKYLKDKLPAGTDERKATCRTVMDKIAKELWKDFTGGRVLFIDNPGTHWPQKEMLTELSKIEPGISFRRAVMLSHVPLDYHLYTFFKTFHILESYTGKIKTSKDLNLKVFKDEFIPFNKYTHILFGDGWYMKAQVKGKEKNKAKEIAEKEHWNMLPVRNIYKSIISHNLCDANLLTIDF